MSVLIKMDMPKSCSECQLLEGDTMDGLCHAANKWLDDDYFRWAAYDDGYIDDSKPLNCPLVEVPPHGRLIDADALQKTLEEMRIWGDARVRGFTNSIPTIIPAEEKK